MKELYNHDMEEAVIGALLIDKRCHHLIIPMINNDVFHDQKNFKIFYTIRELYLENEPIDILTVVDRMTKTGRVEQETAYQLTQMTSRVATSAHAEYHSKMIIELYLRRQMITISDQYQSDFADTSEDVFYLLNQIQVDILNLTKFMEAGRNVHVSKLISKVYESAINAQMNESHMIGISTGYYDLDQITRGWQQPDLIILAGRPAMGKTAFLLNLAKNSAVKKNKVGIFSLEMSGEQLATRLLSMEAGITTGDIQTGSFNNIETSVDKCANLGIIINDTAGISALDLKASARKMVIEDKVKMIFIDYIQLMEGRERGVTREQEISKISRTLKIIAKDLKIPVIALSQLSRAVEQRSDKRPVLSDLRESGAIEQDADKVIFLYRPEYYGETEDEWGNSTRGITEVIIAKHRNGAIGTVELSFIDKYTKFVNKNTLVDDY